MKSTLQNATFALNDKKINEKTQTFIFNYRLGYVYAGAAFGTTQIAFTESGTEAMDCYANTIGGNLGAILPFGRGDAVQLDVAGLKPMNVKDTQQRTVDPTTESPQMVRLIDPKILLSGKINFNVSADAPDDWHRADNSSRRIMITVFQAQDTTGTAFNVQLSD